MNVSNILYYGLKLIFEGQKWQYQNVTCTNKAPKLYFTSLQWIAILLALLFVLKNQSGLSSNTIDYLLSSLSIMTGLFLALIVIVYDKFKEIVFDAETDDNKIKQLKSWNYLRQFNTLTLYAIFIALIVILILIGSLLYGHSIDLSEISIATSLNKVDFGLSIKVIITILLRISTIYFLFDFFILTVYAVSSLFQFINNEMLSIKPPYTINEKKVVSDMQILKKEYPKHFFITKITLRLLTIGLFMYELNIIRPIIYRIFLLIQSI